MSSFPLINQGVLDLTGCDVATIPLPTEALEFIQKATTGEIFVNPVQDVITKATSKVTDIVNDVNAGIGDIFMSSDGTILGIPLPGSGAGLDANGDPEPIRLTTFVSNFSQEVSEKIAVYQEQSDILSGVSIGKDGFDGNGGVSDMPGIASVQSIAAGFNQVTNALSNEDELKDNYTQFFGSILGPGSQVFEGVNAALSGDFEGALSNFPRNEDGTLILGNANVSNLTALIDAKNDVIRAANDVVAFVQDERALVTAATTELVKATFGFELLAMLADPCFGEKVASKILKPS